MESAEGLNKYKLSAELNGHSMDVRSVTEGRDCIISGARDKTTKIWKWKDGKYVEDITLKHHRNFICCVYYCEEEHWICTGSNDSTICVYNEGEPNPFATLRGHENTVCAIVKGLQPGTLLSGSWDHTGRVWDLNGFQPTNTVVLKGHEAAVWAVATLYSGEGKYVTGSADKNIFIWNVSGEKLQTLSGHTDCVRGLIGMSDGSLISCSNDASIRYWNQKGECIRELHGHGNYIYTIALNKSIGDDVIVSGGEDSCLRIWSLKSGSLGDSLILPAQSIWSVACLRNGDIVTGTSDGVVRIFTKDPERFAQPDLIRAFNGAVKCRQIEAEQKLGGISKNELPGPESLLQDGKEGQTKMIRHPNGKINCYEWGNNQWNLIGEVMGASGGTQTSSGKTLFEGKEYDFIFSVDISDTEPPIKLPYNRGEDPWLAAQTFIHKNNLPQVYLDQVANFIITNSDAPIIQETNTGYQDPFTGGSRYIPGSNNERGFASTGNADPFTGSASYSTNSQQQNHLRGEVKHFKHFPQTTFTTFDNCDPIKILDKLKDFNRKATDKDSQVPEEHLEALIAIMKKEPEINKSAIDTLQHLLKWPKNILFPVLDITRLAIRNEQIYVLLQRSTNLITILIENLTDIAANQLMSVRALANMMKHATGRKDVESKLQEIIDIMTNIKHGNGNLQIAIATLYLNLTISQTYAADSEACRIITEGVIEFLKWVTDVEASYRTIQSLGNLSSTSFGSVTTAQIISVDFVVDKIKALSAQQSISGMEKLSGCAKELLQCF